MYMYKKHNENIECKAIIIFHSIVMQETKCSWINNSSVEKKLHTSIAPSCCIVSVDGTQGQIWLFGHLKTKTVAAKNILLVMVSVHFWHSWERQNLTYLLYPMIKHFYPDTNKMISSRVM